METLKEQDERAVGERFIEWFNAQFDSNYTFSRRAGEAPDLVYVSSDKKELFIEVTSAYYGNEYAKFIWNGVRNSDDRFFSQAVNNDIDGTLTLNIIDRVAKKCEKRYEQHCILVVNVTSFFTSVETLTELLLQHSFPDNNFAGIYVDGRFPITSSSNGGYCMIPIKPYVQGS